MHSSRLMLHLLFFSLFTQCSWAEVWDQYRLWYDQPARKWTEALPVGNGRLGAMCFGGGVHARIQLNEESIWAGPPVSKDSPTMRRAIGPARKAWFAGDYARAHQLMQDALGPRIAPRSHQTLGDLRLQLVGTSGSPTNYRRELNLDTAIAKTTFNLDRVEFTRQVFASQVDDVLVIRFSADRKASINMEATIDRPDDFEVHSLANGDLQMRGQAQQSGKHLGVKWLTMLRTKASGGQIQLDNNKIVIRDAGTVTFYLAVATDYNRQQPAESLQGDLGSQCLHMLDCAEEKDYQRLHSEHVAAHQEMFRRVSLELENQNKSNTPTDQRLNQVKRGMEDPGLVALYFQYGRYLLISCSRPGCMPSNLQGLWNDQLAAAWNADYHININTQMHYWPAELTNLSECHEPFFDFTERLIPSGRETARTMFAARGVTAGHTTDAWVWTAIFGDLHWGMWPHGLAWNALHFTERYRFTGNKEFLRQRAYPLLKEASLFYLDYLTPHPKTGQLMAGPDTSPENLYLGPDGKKYSISMGPSMSQQIAWETFTSTLETAEVLKIEDDFVLQVRHARDRLSLPQVGSDGRLMEWIEEFEEPEPGHRHISHLFAIHPGRQYNRLDSPEMITAARRSIDHRLASGGGHTGWSRAWIINFFARFGDGIEAHKNIQALLAKSTHPNLFDDHPPFQIDGNFGATAGVAEMLLQSHVQHGPPDGPFEIELLPALPAAAWPSGSVTGLRARGAFEVSIDWQDKKLEAATIKSHGGKYFLLKYSDTLKEFHIAPGQVMTIDAELNYRR